ncbi:MAG: AIR synthase-related protein [Pyramidobacter sp.]|nr:AIR synthase-related protein [Pyramidobacter sp.]
MNQQETHIGKLPPTVLEKQILKYCGAHRPEVLIGPGVGEDAALIDWPRGKLLAVSSDPIVGAEIGAGRYLVHVNANDIACKGGDPAYLVVTLIIPKEYGREFASQVMAEAHEACLSINVSIIGGHTEITDRYAKPVIMGTMLGTTDYNYRADSICPGDCLIVTKHVGLEGMSIIAHDRPDLLSDLLTPEQIAQMRSWLHSVSVLNDAHCIRDLARFMHDPTEGGFMGGMTEISRLGRLGIQLDHDAVPVHPWTRRVSQKLGFDPLKLISSGVLLAVVPENAVSVALSRLHAAGIDAVVAGRVTESPSTFEISTDEELWRVLAMERRKERS